MPAQFHAVSYSPWSEKARWALDHHQVDYEEKNYVPLISEPAMRARLGRWTGKVSVPVYIDGKMKLTESLAIAKHADAIGAAPSLFGSGQEDRWDARADEAMSAGRGRTARALVADPEAQREALVGLVPKRLRGPLRGVARAAASNLLTKYPPAPESRVREALADWRDALGGRATLGARFGFADIAMAQVLEFVAPHPRVRRGRATLRAWTDPVLAEEFSDLVAWRDALYAAFR